MTGPDEYRGNPPGGSWPPPGSDRAAPPTPTGWVPDPNRPGPGWSAAVTGAGGPYPPPGAVPTAPAGQSGPAPRAKLEPAKLFGLVIAALGALNFAFGFLPQVTASRLDESLSVYAVGPGYVPILLLIAGLLALGAFLPGSERSRLAVAAVSVGGAVGALISLGTTGPVEMLTTAQVSKGLGAVPLTIFGIIQAVVAIAAYVVGADFGARSGQAVVTVARDPATGAVCHAVFRSCASGRPRAGAAAAGIGGLLRRVCAAPGSPTGAGPAASGWAPPADDDRPTAPQRVVDRTPLRTATPGRGPLSELPRFAGGAGQTGAPDQGTG